MLQNLTNEKSVVGYVMVWCHQATSHDLSQCWPRSPDAITRSKCWCPISTPIVEEMYTSLLDIISKAFISNETQNIVKPLDKLSVLETKKTKFFDYLTKYHSIR